MQKAKFYSTVHVFIYHNKFLKKLVTTVGENIDSKFTYKEIDYPYEEAGYKLVLSELEKREQEEKSRK